jgi:hypothetical protein
MTGDIYPVPCPSCGYCPTCGRQNNPGCYQPYVPVYPTYVGTLTTGGTTGTNTSGNT